MEVHFIINEQAGDGKGAKVWASLRKNINYSFHLTERRGHAIELTKQLAGQTSESLLLIVIGGDGTIHEVLNGVVGYPHVTVGVMKAGSGNDFAREFPAFTNLQEIENYIAIKPIKRKTVDFGSVQLDTVHQRYFASNSGFGLDADISLAASQSTIKKTLNKWKLGSVVYALTVAKSLLAFKPFNAEIQIGSDIRMFRKVWMITVSNQKYYGGGMKISPQSIYDDGEFELTVVHSISTLKFLAVFLTVFTGSHTRLKGVSTYTSDTFIIEPDRMVGCHTDGEYIGTTSDRPVICKVDERKWYVADQSSV
ncbi:diacylglycerol kinase family protein [Sporosarcina ureae]|uniref:diacylglycerol/lipid kinase family protein n=1 Tax=Sporosarcina ureae TaxID=1571 RepID=UPI0026EA4861|nr:diacylglycerol kinase family protein [Sporosarcina ureae]